MVSLQKGSGLHWEATLHQGFPLRASRATPDEGVRGYTCSNDL